MGAWFSYVMFASSAIISEPLLILFLLKVWLLIFIFTFRQLNSLDGSVLFLDPVLHIITWSFLYFVLPTYAWLFGQRIPHSANLTENSVIAVQKIHLIFLCSFFSVFLLKNRTTRIYKNQKIPFQHLPSGWPILMFGMIPVIFEVVTRVVQTGNPLPQTTYGENWLALQDELSRTKSEGGLAYLVDQVLGKAYFWFSLAKGFGLGLIASRALRRSDSYGAVVLIYLLFFLFDYFLGGGSRSGSIVPLIIAFTITVTLCRSPSTFYFICFTFFGLVAFSFLGIVRQENLTESINNFVFYLDIYTQSFWLALSEFTVMLSKEAHMYESYGRTAGFEPLNFIMQIFSLVPSQIYRSKLEYFPTADFLSQEFLGEMALLGVGVAGTMVGDAWRVGGFFGVAVYGVFLGWSIAKLSLWLLQGNDASHPSLTLLRISLFSGLIANLFLVVRSDLSGFITHVVYNLFIPFLLLRYFLGKKNRNLFNYRKITGTT